jgi:hypothetical protein
METQDKLMTRRQKAAEFFFNEDDKHSLFYEKHLKQKIQKEISRNRGRAVKINNFVKVHLPMLKRCEGKTLVWSSKIDIEIAIVEELAKKDGGSNGFPRIQRPVRAPIEQKTCKVIWSVLVNERNEWSSAHIEEIHCQ